MFSGYNDRADTALKLGENLEILEVPEVPDVPEILYFWKIAFLLKNFDNFNIQFDFHVRYLVQKLLHRSRAVYLENKKALRETQIPKRNKKTLINYLNYSISIMTGSL